MISNLETLNAPEWVIVVALLLLVAEGLIKLCSFIWGWFASKFLKIQTNLSRKKALDNMLIIYQEDLNKIKADQIKDREASKQADKELRESISETNKKIDKIGDLVLGMRVETMRKTLLDFASAVGGGRRHTKEQFDEMLILFEDYEKLLAAHGMTNGRMNISMEIVKDEYKKNIINHGFLEDAFRQEEDDGQFENRNK